MKNPTLTKGTLVFVNHIYELFYSPPNQTLNGYPSQTMAKHCIGIVLDHHYEKNIHVANPLDLGFLYYTYFNFTTRQNEIVYYSNVLEVLS